MSSAGVWMERGRKQFEEMVVAVRSYDSVFLFAVLTLV